MIKAFHAIIYSRDAEATRAFFRDTLNMPFVDAGGGWLIFALPPAEIGVHPTEGEDKHQFSLICDNVAATVEELKAKGVEFEGGIDDHGWGVVSTMKIPGAGTVMLYQPRHASPLNPV